MKQNEGTIDRVIRLVLGAGLVTGGFFATGVIAIVLWGFGGIALFTGLTGFCLLYMPFGFSTKKQKK
jgi:hypothetical protein